MGSFSALQWVYFAIGLILALAAMRFVLWLLGQSAGALPAAERRTDSTPMLRGDGRSAVSVAGIEHHAAAMRAAMRTRRARLRKDAGDDHFDTGDSEEVEVKARLVLEDDNPHDNNAVAVFIRQHKVGYLPAKLAPAFRSKLTQLALPGAEVSCNATVDVPLGEGDYAMALDLPRLVP